MRATALLAALTIVAALPAASPAAAAPQPGTPEYFQRDSQNMADAYGRQTAPDGQLSPDYLAAVPDMTPEGLQQALEQADDPTRPIVDPGQWFPGWNGGNAYRVGWAGVRGREIRVKFTNRYGALLKGDVYAPLRGAKDPYTGKTLHAPYPAVVITTGSIQGSEKMYRWLAQDLAERGYVVLTYDVQGQGRSETFPHQGPEADFPYCDPNAEPADGEQNGCPGVPFQQTANFVYGTIDATDVALSTPSKPYPNPASGSAKVDRFNPLWRLIDRRADKDTVTPGRTTRLAIVGDSLGATAVSFVQAFDRRVEAVVALDKLSGAVKFGSRTAKPVVPALGIQSEYGFNVVPYWMMGGSSIAPQPRDPSQAPDPKREERTGFDGWRTAGVDSMMIVPRASTHLEYTDINFALPASRYGQDVTSWYVQAWLDKYLKHEASGDGRLLATRFTYLEPKANGVWGPVPLERADRLSFYFCSGYAFRSAGGALLADGDVGRVGGC